MRIKKKPVVLNEIFFVRVGWKQRFSLTTFDQFFFKDKPNEIVVTWSTMDDTSNTLVEYGTHTPGFLAIGRSFEFVDGGKDKHKLYIHKVMT